MSLPCFHINLDSLAAVIILQKLLVLALFSTSELLSVSLSLSLQD